MAIAGVDAEPGAVEADVLRLYHHPLVGFDALAPAFLADLNDARAPAGRAVPRARLRQAREPCSSRRSPLDNPSRVLCEAAAAVPFTAFCAAAVHRSAPTRTPPATA